MRSAALGKTRFNAISPQVAVNLGGPPEGILKIERRAQGRSAWKAYQRLRHRRSPEMA